MVNLYVSRRLRLRFQPSPRVCGRQDLHGIWTIMNLVLAIKVCFDDDRQLVFFNNNFRLRFNTPRCYRSSAPIPTTRDRTILAPSAGCDDQAEDSRSRESVPNSRIDSENKTSVGEQSCHHSAPNQAMSRRCTKPGQVLLQPLAVCDY